MSHKKIIYCTAVMLCMFICMCTGCASKPGAGASSDVIEYQRKLSELESTIRNYETAFDDTVRALRALRDRSEDMGTTIDGTIELFGQYQQLVEQLIRNYNTLRNEVKDTVSCTGCIIDSNSDTYYIYDSRVHPVHTRYKSAEMAGHLAIVQEKENEHRE